MKDSDFDQLQQDYANQGKECIKLVDHDGSATLPEADRLALLGAMYGGVYSDSFPEFERMSLAAFEEVVKRPQTPPYYDISIVGEGLTSGEPDVQGLVISSLYPDSHTMVLEYIANDPNQENRVRGKFLKALSERNMLEIAEIYDTDVRLYVSEASVPKLMMEQQIDDVIDPYNRIHIQTLAWGADIVPIDYTSRPNVDNEFSQPYLLLMAYDNPANGEPARSEDIEQYLRECFHRYGIDDPESLEEFTLMLEQLKGKEPPSMYVQDALDSVREKVTSRPPTTLPAGVETMGFDVSKKQRELEGGIA